MSDFGRQMVADHGKANKQLDELARAAKVPQPKDADEQHKAMLQHVDKLNGGNFDLAYIRGQVTDHPQLKAFTAQALPMVLHQPEFINSFESEARNRPSYKTVNVAVLTY